VAQLGRIDVLVNNAGGLVQRAPIEQITDELYDQVLDLNVRSVLMCSAAAVAHMRRQGQGGSIINLTSVAARHGGGAGAALYAGSKGFVATITKGLAKELVKDRIRVNAVAPGVIRTPMTERYFQDADVARKIQELHAMGRSGETHEVANAMMFLASEESSFTTGAVLTVDGGWTLGKKMT
jgi:3-oxoacyl-[acyl-carrier protein] reductase